MKKRSDCSIMICDKEGHVLSKQPWKSNKVAVFQLPAFLAESATRWEIIHDPTNEQVMSQKINLSERPSWIVSPQQICDIEVDISCLEIFRTLLNDIPESQE